MSAPKSPPKAPKEKTSSITWKGRKLSLEWRPSGWRLRSRSRHFPVDYSTNILTLQAAKDDAKKWLEREEAKKNQPKGNKTLEDVVTIYKRLPKRASAVTESGAIAHLRTLVRIIYGYNKELKDVPATEVNAKFWLRYIAKRQGREVADLSTRDPINKAINSAMNNAACVFKKTLIPLYAEHGIVFSPDVTAIQWMAVPQLPKPEVQRDDLASALKTLRATNETLWAAICAARYAGLRRKEVIGLSKSWVEVDGTATYIRVRDRPEEGWRHKTGENYRALVIDPEFAEFLRNAPDGHICQPINKRGGDMAKRTHWFYTAPQKWLKTYTTATASLHRMRGVYLDDVARLTRDAVSAHLAGVKAAQEAAGHTSSKTTERHYLSND